MLLTLAAAIPALIVMLPLVVFAVELAAGLWPGRPDLVTGTGPRDPDVRCVVLVPAHDEAAGIGATLAWLFTRLPPRAQVLVVADNCHDDTAAIARAAGAEVVERHDPDRRGKGYALAFGRDHLAALPDPPDVVVVLDADCRPQDDAITKLACAARWAGAPFQATYLFRPSHSDPPLIQLSNFAMRVKNLHRSRGMQRLGGAALLTGSGMAFPWQLFAAAHLATGSIVEDLALGIALTRAGHRPRLLGAALVISDPAAMTDALGQRQRWEHGFLDTLRRLALPILVGGLARRSLRETLLGLHLLVPPLALLLFAAATVLGIAGLMTIIGAAVWPFLLVAGATTAALALVFVAWVAGGRAWLSAAAVLHAPFYVVWKLTMYRRFFLKPQTDWQRTPRTASLGTSPDREYEN